MRVAIVLFWLAMTGWLVQRDVLPRLGFGELDYRVLLAHRAVEKPVHWKMSVNGRPVGSVESNVRPLQEGGYALMSRARIDAELLSSNRGPGDADLVINSSFYVSGLGRLQRFSMRISVQDAKLHVEVDGTVEEDQLRIRTSGLEIIENEFTVPIAPEAVTLDKFGPIDRIPGLRVGKTWTTRSVNPFASVLSPAGLFGSGPTIDVVHHEVTGTETVRWNGRAWPCYVVKRRQDNVVARTWARVSDGRVLRHETPVGGLMLVLEPERPDEDDL